MKVFRAVAGLSLIVGLSFAASGQQEKGGQASGSQRRVDAQQGQTPDIWTLASQTWDFKDVQAAYEPAKGHLESRERGDLAVWRLRLTKDFEEGTQRFHDDLRGSPFKVVLLDADRAVINPDVPASITPVPARMDDTVEMYVALPEDEILRQVKYIRVQRRTDVGF